jgi:hypothetical protein
MRKAPLEFSVCLAQGGLGIDVQMARKVGHGEQKIAEFLFLLLLRCRAQLVRLLVDLEEHIIA